MPVHSYVAYRCPIGWAFSANPNVEPYKKLVCQPHTGTFDGIDDEWPQCFDPNAAEGRTTRSVLTSDRARADMFPRNRTVN